MDTTEGVLEEPVPSFPRDTLFWRARWPQIVHDSLVWRTHPDLFELWEIFVCSVRLMRELTNHSELSELEESWAAMSFRAFTLLRDLIPIHFPQTAHVLGGHLPLYLLAWADYELTGEITDNIPETISHFPGNPYTLDRGGSFVGPPLSSLDTDFMRCMQELRDYNRSLRPAKRRGRPKQPEGPPTVPQPNSLNPALALRAYQMHSDGTPWRAIARVVFPGCNLRDPCEAERIRGRVRRLIYRGNLLADKEKSGCDN